MILLDPAMTAAKVREVEFRCEIRNFSRLHRAGIGILVYLARKKDLFPCLSV
jgi:hypothetical protein